MIVTNCIFEKEMRIKLIWSTFLFVNGILFDVNLLMGIIGIDNFGWHSNLLFSLDGIIFTILIGFICPVFSGMYGAEISKRIKNGDTSPMQYDKFIKSINFKEETLEIFFYGYIPNEEYYYNKIKNLKLYMLNPTRLNSRYVSTIKIEKLFINFDVEGKTFTVRCNSNMDSLTKIIYYSQYVKNFSYEYIEAEDEIKMLLDDYIQCYIGNNYNNTLKNTFKITHF